LKIILAINTTWASFAIMRTGKFKFLHQLEKPAVFIFIILSLSGAISNFGNLFAEAQSSVSTIQNGQDSNEPIQTFYIDGAIGSLVSNLPNSTIGESLSNSSAPVQVLVGNWSMGVVNGEVNYLQVDFIVALEDGSQMQVYSIENLENIVISPASAQSAGSTPDQEITSDDDDNLVLNSANNYSLSLFGYVDVLSDDTVQWQNVPTSINIFNGNTISILLYPSETDNRFNGQPIYGVVTEILNANNEPIKPSIWTSGSI
jgi:hypothetical protein